MRYFQPKEYQYVSQYTPEMAAMDYQKGQDLIKQEEAFNKDLNDIKSKYTLSKGQYASQGLVDKANNTIQTSLNQVTQDLYNNKIGVREANSKLATIANYFNTDPFIQGIKADKELTEKEKAQVASGKLNPKSSLNTYGAPIWSMDEKRRVKEIDDPQELVNKLPFLYNTLDRGDPVKVAQEALKGILEKSGYSTFIPGKDYRFEYKDVQGKPGEKLLVAIDEGGREISSVGISAPQIRQAVTDLVKSKRNSPDQFWEWHNRNQSTDEDIINELVGSYPGSFQMTTNKKEEDKIQYIGDGSGKGKKEELETPKETAIQSTTTISGSKIKYLNAEGKEYSITDPIKFQTELLNNRQVIKNKVDKFKSSLESTYPGVSFDVRSENNSNYIVPIIPDNYDKSKISNINASIATINKNLIENGIKQIAAERALIDVKTAWKNNYEKDLGPLNSIYLTKAQEKEAIDDLGLDNYKYLIGSIQEPTHDKVVKAFKDKINYYNQFSNKNAFIGNTDKTPLMYITELNRGLAEFEKNYETNIKTVNPSYKAYIELVKQATDNITYKDQTLLSLDDKPESSKLKDLMFENLTDPALFLKNVRNADSNTDLGSLKNDLKDPDYLKIVKERLASGAKVFYNKETNLWESYIELPNTDKNKGNHKLIIAQDLNQPFIASFAESRGFSYNYYKVLKEHDYYSSINDAGFGMIKSNMTVDKNQDNIDDTEYDYKLNSNVIKTIGLNLVTQQVKVNTKYTDKSTGLVINLDKGNTVFEIPELPQTQGILFKTQDEQGLMRFHNDLDHAVASKNEIAINSILSNINTYGIQPINNTTAYENFDRDRKLNYDESVQIKKETDKLNSEKSNQDSQRELKILNALRQGWITDNNAEFYRQNPNYEYLDRDLKNAEANFKFNKERAAKFYKDNEGK